MNIIYYATSSGKEPARKFIADLPFDPRYEILALLRRMEGGEVLAMPHARSLSSMAHGLYELRVRDSGGIVRMFYYTKIQNSIFLLHAVRKKGRTIGGKDRELILKRIRDLNNRYG